MLSITTLPLLALLLPAVATLACFGLGRPWPRQPGFWARWVLRLGLVLALADAVTVFRLLQLGGTLHAVLWRLDPQLPITLSVDSGGAALAIMVLVAALVVSFAARDRRPLASAALGLAVVGATGAVFAGDLLGLYIGLQLSALGGIGLSYARQPRAASTRMVWSAIADQGVGLIWLGVMVVLLQRTSTLQLTAIPTSTVSPTLAGLLLLPAVVRLAGCGLLAGSAANARATHGSRSLDVADWLTVVAVPTSLLVLIRVQALSGGTWPAPWFGTALDLLAVVVGGAALALMLASRDPHAQFWALLCAMSALVIVGFGQNTADGTLLGLAAGLFLEVSCAFLPRALLGRRGGRAREPKGPVSRPVAAQGLLGGAAVLLPWLLAAEVAYLGLALVLRAGLEAGFAPSLAYLVAMAALALGITRLRQGPWRTTRWSWPLWLPALCLGAAAILPGWALTLAAGSIAPPGTAALSLLSAPDPFVVLGPGLVLPGGYLVILLMLLSAGGWALRTASGAGVAALPPVPPADSAPSLVLPAPLAAMVGGRAAAPAWAKEARGWYLILVRLADREVGERPVLLWVAAAAAAAWLLAEWVKL